MPTAYERALDPGGLTTVDHLAPFDCFRTLLCLAVLTHHVLFYATAASPARGPAWERSKTMEFLSHAGLPAVDVFLLIAGYFSGRSCLRIILSRAAFPYKYLREPTAAAAILARVKSRWVRFSKVHLVVIAVAFLTHGRDPHLQAAPRLGLGRLPRGLCADACRLDRRRAVVRSPR